MDEPPELKKGRTIPATGKKLKHIPKLNIHWDKIKPRNEWNFDDIMYKRLGAESLYTFDKDTELISKLEGEVIWKTLLD